ncbi:MAG TPA: AI-2E family transporter [Ignavibacteriaceae bacterium]|nr:AI-2E family transporter [Ignavibacteriaceae bacterium]
MSIYTINQSKIIAVTLIFILGAFLFYSLNELYTAILGSIVLYVLFKPMYIKMIERKKWNKKLSSIIIIILSFIIIIIPFMSVTWMLINKILYLKDHPQAIKKVINTVQTFIGKNIGQDTIKNAIDKASTVSIEILSSFINTFLDILLTVSMMYFFLYYMFTKMEVFEETLIKYMPFRGQNSAHFANELKNMTHANVIGQGIIAFAQALLLGIGLVIFGAPDPLFWSLLCFFFSFLPVIGSAAAFIPAGLAEIASGNTFNGVGVIIFGFVAVSNIDNLLRLWINKWLGNIHPLITITGIVIGIPIFGILGIVFGPLLISTFVLLVKLYETAYAEKTNEKERVVSEEEIRSV